MDNKVFKFYEVFKKHEFSEEEMNAVVDGIKAILHDETRENATGKDIRNLTEALRGDLKDFENSIDKKLSRLDDRTDKLYDKFHQIIIWVVSTGIGVTGIIIAVIKLL